MPLLPENLRPDPIIELYKRDVDMTLVRENRTLTYTERARKLMELQRVATELRRVGREARAKR